MTVRAHAATLAVTRAATLGATLLLPALLLPGGCAASAAEPATTAVADVDGARVAPLAVPAGSVHVLLFVTTDCPIANSYAPEISALAAELRGTEVTPFLVHVAPDVDAAAAKAHARAYGLELRILLDPEQRLARAVGATATPEAAVLTAAGLQYLGRIDDRWRKLGADGQVPEHRDLRDAIAAVRAGRAVAQPRTETVGCLLPTPR
jgi:hypothetical protein